MARIKKKGNSGNAKNYITRSQAVRKLQVSLSDFRRLCIFKGIYPREPRHRRKAFKSATPSTTFYYAKDIQYLLHEPLLEKFRQQKVLAKKISRALGRNDTGGAQRLERALTPRLKLDHIVKERYPTFVDALRDLDDALSVLFLFTSLPASEDIPAKVIAQCQRLTLEFEHYVIRTNSLRKSFLSIKGIYYQVTIEGQDILWLVPYRFVQRAGADIDFRIMSTFVDFYITLLGFVNFRLYTGIGLVYPPSLDHGSLQRGSELGAMQLYTNEQSHPSSSANEGGVAATGAAQSAADQIGSNIQINATANAVAPTAILDKFTSIDKSADLLLQPSIAADANVASCLFQNLTIYISRECPRHSLEFVLKAFGCKRVGWDVSSGETGSYCLESDARITYQIVDRSNMQLNGSQVGQPDKRTAGRVYVQPQWVWDSINAGELQRADLYAPGATLPPHLSPWMKPQKGEYDPSLPLDQGKGPAIDSERSITDVTSRSNIIHATSDRISLMEYVTEERDDSADMTVQLAGSVTDEHDSIQSRKDWRDLQSHEENSFSDDDTNHADLNYQAGLEAERSGSTIPNRREVKTAAKDLITRREQTERLATEDIERRKMMMPRRKRKMYEKMVFSNARKEEAARDLREKRRKFEGRKGSATFAS